MPADRSRLPDVGFDPPFRLPAAVHHELANGLRVRTIEHASVPVVTFIVLVEGGSGADPAGREGLAALTVDLVDEGTGSASALDVSDAIARIGGHYDADVGADATVFTFTTLARFAERGAALLADLIVRPSLRQDDFERVRQLRLDRLRQLKDVPAAVGERALLRLFYGEHPYGHLAIGSDAALRGLAVEDAASFHGATFRPRRATVVAAGALDHAALLAIVERTFGAWTSGPGGDADVPAADIAVTGTAPPRLVLLPRADAQQSDLRIGRLSVRRDTPDYFPLLVMNAVLGGQFVSRVNLKLREEKAFTYGARTGFDWRRGPSTFALQASVHTASTAEAIDDSMRELDALRRVRPVTSEELTLAKASLTRGYPRNFETAEQVARGAAQLALYGLSDTYFETFVPNVHTVTAADITDAAWRHLDPERFTAIVVGDREVIEEPLAALGLGAPVVLAPDA